ncbi:uncharacterized protein [Dysidea avara]|uniref:uncharacterized protein n=1 Tax=Dysidea avara TaxID=196820 RepID=UPI00331FE2E5
MKTPIYIKMDAPESLLLSEGMCRKLGIISYHPNVQDGGSTKQDQSITENSCTVPTVRVRLIHDIHLLPDECVTAQVKLEGEVDMADEQPFLIEADHNKLREIKMKEFDVVVQVTASGVVQLSLINQLGMSQKIDKGMAIPNVLGAMQCCDSKQGSEKSVVPPIVAMVSGSIIAEEERKGKLKEYLESVEISSCLTSEENCAILSLLENYHDVFSLIEGNEERQIY